MAFVDLTKAFDTVNRDLWNILRKFGCPPTFIVILQQFHTCMCAQVVMVGSQFSSFPVEVGVKQGCVLAPIIFNLLIVVITLVSHHDTKLLFSGDLKNEMQTYINVASSAFGRLSKRVFGKQNLTIHTRIAVYKAVVISTILYDCESWVPYRRHIRLLESFHIRHLQLILGLRWWHKVTHSESRSRAGIASIKSMLLHCQLRWLGHVIRMPHSWLSHCVLYGQLKLGHRNVGGQKKRFKDHIKSILKKCNIPFSRLETLASNRATWRSTCAFGMSYVDDEYDRAAALRCSRIHQHAPVLCPIPNSVRQCPLCDRQCFSRIGLLSHSITNFQR